MEAQRALLDELMGLDRNAGSDEKNRNKRSFSDENVCKFYLCGFCPHDLFTNTKSDLGPCPKLHDDNLKREWDNYPHKERYPYDSDFVRFLERQVNDVDRRIEKHHKRLELQEGGELPENSALRIASIDAECEVLLRKIEALGEEGLVDEATTCHDKLKTLKSEKDGLIKAAAQAGSAISGLVGANPEKRMRVCEICGAYLVVSDTEKRMASHLEGKQHTGYALIREALESYRKRREEKEAERLRRNDRRDGERRDTGRPDRDDRKDDRRRSDWRDDRKDDRRRDDRRRDDYRRDRRDDRRDRYDERDSRSKRERSNSRSRSRERDDKRSRR